VRGEVGEDPTVVIPVIPVVPRQPVPNPYGPPAGLGYPPPPGYAGPPKRSGRGWVIGGIAAAAVALLLGLTVSANSTMDVTGTFTLLDDGGYRSLGAFTSGSSCEGDGGYSDIHAGTQVTVADAAGTVVATGILGSGTARSIVSCEFAFTVPDVPTGEDFYQVTVSHRGTLTYTADELASGLSLGLGS
jgi:hypothetical protein